MRLAIVPCPHGINHIFSSFKASCSLQLLQVFCALEWNEETHLEVVFSEAKAKCNIPGQLQNLCPVRRDPGQSPTECSSLRIIPANVSSEAIHLKATESQFHHLRQAFYHNEDRSQPTVSVHFDAKSPTTSIHRKNTTVHTAVVGDTISQLGPYLRLIPPDFNFRPGAGLSSNFHHHFPDPQLASRPSIPNLQVAYTDEAAGLMCEPIFVLELSQSSQDLEEPVRSILEGLPLVKTAILVDIKETPMFKNPLREKETKKLSATR